MPTKLQISSAIILLIGIVLFLILYKSPTAPVTTSTTVIPTTTIQTRATTSASTTIKNELNALCPCLNELQIKSVLGVSPSAPANFTVAYLPNAAEVDANALIQSSGKTGSGTPTNITAGWIISYKSTQSGTMLREYIVANSNPQWLSNYYQTTGYASLKFNASGVDGFQYAYNSTASKLTLIGYKDGYTVVLTASGQVPPQSRAAENLSYTI